MKLIDFIILGAVALVVAVAVIMVFKKRGKCSCGCDGCSCRNSCEKKKNYLVRISNFNWQCIKLIFIIPFAL